MAAYALVGAHIIPRGDIVPPGEYIAPYPRRGFLHPSAEARPAERPSRSTPLGELWGDISRPSNFSFLSSRASDISPFLVPTGCSSGSTPKSTSPADFWSLFNEDPLDENHRFWVNRLFLFAHPSGRARRRLRAAIRHPDDKSRQDARARRAHQAPARHTDDTAEGPPGGRIVGVRMSYHRPPGNQPPQAEAAIAEHSPWGASRHRQVWRHESPNTATLLPSRHRPRPSGRGHCPSAILGSVPLGEEASMEEAEPSMQAPSLNTKYLGRDGVEPIIQSSSIGRGSWHPPVAGGVDVRGRTFHAGTLPKYEVFGEGRVG